MASKKSKSDNPNVVYIVAIIAVLIGWAIGFAVGYNLQNNQGDPVNPVDKYGINN